MGDIRFMGGLAQGLGQGMQQAQHQSLQQEMLDLQKKQIKLDSDKQQKMMDVINTFTPDELKAWAGGAGVQSQQKLAALISMLTSGIQGETTPTPATQPSFLQSILPGPTTQQLGEQGKYWSSWYNIPENTFLRTIGAESGWDPKAVSPKGAMGLGQIMPENVKAWGITDPFDPNQNLAASAWYLRSLYDKTGDWGKALKMYEGYSPESTPPATSTFARVMGAPAPTQVQTPVQGNSLLSGLVPRLIIHAITGVDIGGSKTESHPRENDITVFDPFGRPTAVYPGAPEMVQTQIEGLGGETYKGWVEKPRTAQPWKQPLTVGGSPQLGTTPGTVTPPRISFPQKVSDQVISPQAVQSGPPNIPGVTGMVQTGPAKGAPTADAGKIQLTQTGLEAYNMMMGYLYDEKGELQKWNLINAKLGTPWTQGRHLDDLAFAAMDALQRAATGAVVNAGEWEKYKKTYIPSIMDSQATIDRKMTLLSGFLNGYLEKIDPTGAIRIRKGEPIDLTSLNALRGLPPPAPGRPAAKPPARNEVTAGQGTDAIDEASSYLKKFGGK